ncbi:MAG: uroporphyrinogen-III C-methyltransferase [Deltaproteobacteria bacterium]|jgi:uroporphyrinogen III methyltransferase/synthase|nr:uroporphyrinogen-III C-methyltransferase [Deltaproteobacteria bacterium]
MGGKVFLVGAGPGDIELLTLKGAALLKTADVVVYDYLVAEELLDLAPQSQKIYVGKSASHHTFTQEKINELIVKLGQDGKRVVRLKGGDPYIFGRGGEEAEALAEAGVPFEVVPGISSTVAAAAYAGIPLTHRDFAAQVGIMTGHERADKPFSSLDWEALAKMGTLVAVMGSAQLPHICQKLREAGKAGDTPAALVEWGTTYRQRVIVATLLTLPEKARMQGFQAPSLLVVGKVVTLQGKLSWFEKRPLWGKRILVTRTREQAGELSQALKELGANVVTKPVIQVTPIDPNPRLDEALHKIKSFNYLILTSPNGGNIFRNYLFQYGYDARNLAGLKIAVMGPGTLASLNALGINPDIVPVKYQAENLLEEMLLWPPGKVLLVRAKKCRDVLPVGLKKKGFRVTEIPLYETQVGETCPAKPFLEIGRFDLITLTSSSTARGLATLIRKNQRKKYNVASIGPITSQTAEQLGFHVAVESQVATIQGLVEAIQSYLNIINFERI